MKNKIIMIVVVILFIVGLLFILYPTFSNLWNNFNQSHAISNHINQIEKMNKNEIELANNEAMEYNRAIAARGMTSSIDKIEQKTYDSLLNVSKNGIMGYIEIPKINIKLPIYHGTSDQVLQVAIGHVAGTSLPIGGKSTHAVLMGHRGLPSAKLFTSLDKMEIEDIFYIYALKEKLAYKVDEISIVEPEELENLKIIDGEDYVTLVTCTPYGINSHRLLVRGHRITYVDNIKINSESNPIGIIIFLFVILLIVIGVTKAKEKEISKNIKNKKRKNMAKKVTRKK